MADNLSDYFENIIVNWVRGTAAPTAPATIYLALYTVTPSDTGGGTEVTGGAYARQAITLGAPSPAGTTSNTNTITYPTATANWGTVVATGIFDASTAGNLLIWAPETAPNPTVDLGETLTFAPGAVTFSVA